MNFHAIVDDAEQLADKAYGDFKAMIAKHREAIDDDLAAAVEAAAVLPPWARTMVASVVTGLANSLMNGIEGDKAAIVPPQPVPAGTPADLTGGAAGTGPADDASPSEQQPVQDS